MAVPTGWEPPVTGQRYGLSAYGSPSSAVSELHSVPAASAGAEALAQPWNPSNPLFWFGGLALLTFGLMAVSTSVRVGPAKASVSLGK